MSKLTSVHKHRPRQLTIKPATERKTAKATSRREHFIQRNKDKDAGRFLVRDGTSEKSMAP